MNVYRCKKVPHFISESYKTPYDVDDTTKAKTFIDFAHFYLIA